MAIKMDGSDETGNCNCQSGWTTDEVMDMLAMTEELIFGITMNRKVIDSLENNDQKHGFVKGLKEAARVVSNKINHIAMGTNEAK